MSDESSTETSEATGIGDDRLPPDLVPSDDNPLAEGLDEGEDAGDLLHDGKRAAEDEADDEDSDSKD